jgi:hypothetical protein
MPLEVSDIILSPAILYYSDDLSVQPPPDTLAAGQPWGIGAQQTVVLTGATGGTFTLTFNGQTTGAIAYNAAVAAVNTALEALSKLGVDGVEVTGSPGNYTVTFTGKYAGFEVPLLTANATSLTGTTPSIAVTQTVAGSGWKRFGFTAEPLTTGYNFEVARADIQEALGTVKVRKTSHEMMLETTIAEINPVMQFLQWGGKLTIVPAATGQPGKTVLDVGGSNILKNRRFGFEARDVDDDGNDLPLRVILWRATATEGSELEFSKSDFTGAPVKFEALEDMSRPYDERFFRWYRITAPALP